MTKKRCYARAWIQFEYPTVREVVKRERVRERDRMGRQPCKILRFFYLFFFNKKNKINIKK